MLLRNQSTTLYHHNRHLPGYFEFTVADSDGMGRVITQTLDRAFRTLGRAFSFLLNPQKLGFAFQRLSRIF